MVRSRATAISQEVPHAASNASRRLQRRDAGQPGEHGQSRRAAAAPVLLLPLLLLPPQLLAFEQPAMAGSPWYAVHAAARLYGLPAIQRAELALHAVRIAPLLQRTSLLAGPVLSRSEIRKP